MKSLRNVERKYIVCVTEVIKKIYGFNNKDFIGHEIGILRYVDER